MTGRRRRWCRGRPGGPTGGGRAGSAASREVGAVENGRGRDAAQEVGDLVGDVGQRGVHVLPGHDQQAGLIGGPAAANAEVAKEPDVGV